ncbi:Uncharacterized protein TCM_009471 [Theobroma cacao]|uniref:Uncharacterized protein n=1 Tax=Theobroma cacao TaxID=3641 RepID=A0A061E5Z4_THECC|nr:Uncharacterized protein TCM_009471 [Theobroma cacao]
MVKIWKQMDEILKMGQWEKEIERKGRRKEKPKRNKKIQREIRGFRPFTRLTEESLPEKAKKSYPTSSDRGA